MALEKATDVVRKSEVVAVAAAVGKGGWLVVRLSHGMAFVFIISVT